MMLAVKMKAFLEILETTNLIKIKICLHTGYYKSNVLFLSIEMKYSSGLGEGGGQPNLLSSEYGKSLKVSCLETLIFEVRYCLRVS